ncbi:uncharacterized protein LOC100573802 [Acyrthosiphon pisum]|uniref:Phorbol-ester/DAG-type domain-containing protein n=1 Tax=Acyrthosiphon pisum TaxID=7029 RepID=A0A8R1W586_ACYPI|nr:uncharacterized protein LOC100573802 [Acyrthosiphon pisum]|eukprot:XP_003243819.1 PREDICTED: uncharacterized protein LOC100573802 [Acyrthosiphon pisum]
MHTEHSFKKSYFSHLNRCMHCNKISVLAPVFKCTGCSMVSHQRCLEKNQYTINERLRLEKRIVNDQKTPVKIKYNELGELLEPDYLYNMLVIEKRHPISLMSEKYLKARHAEHKSLFTSIRGRAICECVTRPMWRRSGQEPNTTGTAVTVTVTEPEQSTLMSTQEMSTEALEPLVSAAPDTNLEERGQRSVSLELGERAPELGARTPESGSARSPEPNAVASEPDAAKPELSEPVSELSVTNLV